MIDTSSMTSQELDSFFMKSCLEGDLKSVQDLWLQCEALKISRWSEEGLSQAAFWGQKNIVDFFIEENKLKRLYHNYSNAFMAACCNSFEMVQYLAQTVSLKIHDTDELYLPFACKCNQLDTVKYLLKSSEQDFINAHSGQALLYALKYCNWEIVDYLLYSTELNYHADLHIDSDFILNDILTDSQTSSFRQEIVKKLIFDYQMIETDNIKTIIKETKNNWANSLFRTRELHEILESELSSNKNVKKSKI